MWETRRYHHGVWKAWLDTGGIRYVRVKFHVQSTSNWVVRMYLLCSFIQHVQSYFLYPWWVWTVTFHFCLSYSSLSDSYPVFPIFSAPWFSSPLIQVVRGNPLFLFPWGYQHSAILVMLLVWFQIYALNIAIFTFLIPDGFWYVLMLHMTLSKFDWRVLKDIIWLDTNRYWCCSIDIFSWHWILLSFYPRQTSKYFLPRPNPLS